MRAITSRILSLVLSVTVAISLLAAMAYSHQGFAATSAVADEEESVINAPVSAITQSTGSLTIHKFTPASSVLAEPNGSMIATTNFASQGAYPIEGVKFTIKKIKEINLTTNDGWQKAQKLAKTFETNPSEETVTTSSYTFDTPKEQTTGEDGSTDFTKLPLGLYYVQETNEPSDPVKIHSTNVRSTVASSLVPSAPFIIAVPLTNPVNHNQWMYNVHAYPKNSPVSVKKTLNDSATPGAGNTHDNSVISYNVISDIPASVKEVDNYQLIDPLDARLTYLDKYKYADQDIELKFLDASGQTVTSQTLTKDTDYEVQIYKVTPAPTSTTSKPEIGTYVTINFLPKGLKKLITARDSASATKVEWTLYAQLGKLTEAQTDIPNMAYLIPSLPNNPKNAWNGKNGPILNPIPGDSGIPYIPGVPSNQVVSKYGQVILTKKSAKDDSVLKDAKFELYMCNASKQFTDFNGNVLQQQNGDYTAEDLKKWAINVDDVHEWTTGEKGTFMITGLQLNDFKNNSPSYAVGKQSKNWKDDHFYCFRETQAPQNYELLPEPIQFQINTDTPLYTANVEVKDVPSNGGFHLPVTGSQGVIVLLVLGSFLVAGSLIYTVLVAKKRKEETTSL